MSERPGDEGGASAAAAEEPSAAAFPAPPPPLPTNEPRLEELTTARGETTIAPGVIAKIARAAASEVDGVELVSGSGLRSLLSRSSTGGASAAPAGHRTALDLHIAVCWPRPVPQVAEQVRQAVKGKVQHLTGYEVTDVDIVVDSLPEPSGSGRVG